MFPDITAYSPAMAGTSAAARPFVHLNCAISLDGYLDDASSDRLMLSNAEDFDRVDELRAASDAILVGAGTVRRDNPRLMVRSPERRARRTESGHPSSPLRVTLTRTGELDPAAAFFTEGGAASLVYVPASAPASLTEQLAAVAEVADGGDPPELPRILRDLAERGVARVLVEGGGGILTAFLRAGLVDELTVAVAPFLVGTAGAPRFVEPGYFPYGPGSPLRLAEAKTLGDVVVLRYLPPHASGEARR